MGRTPRPTLRRRTSSQTAGRKPVTVPLTPGNTLTSKIKNAGVQWPVFIASSVVILVIALWAILDTTRAGAILGTVVAWTGKWFGWFYVGLAAFSLLFVLILATSGKTGRIKLGPDTSKPEYTFFAWASMLFAAGIGTDLMFFSVAEPVAQYLAPPATQPQTVQAAKEATVWTLFHYGIIGWGMYALMGMALGYFAHRKGLPLAVRSALHPMFGKRLAGAPGHAVDTAAIVGTIFGVATTLGIGVVQLNVGLEIMFGIRQGLPAQIVLVVIAVGVATISATSGVDKGIRILSQLNVLLALFLAFYVLAAGKTDFLLNSLVMNIGDFVSMFPGMAMDTLAYNNAREWMNAWTLFFWAWWIAWASFVGMFLARISRGRTIREFVIGTLTLPFAYILMWVSIFGNAAIDRIRSGDSAFGQQTLKVPEYGFYALLQQYPAAFFIVGLATIVGLLFYVTSADSGALVMANLSSTRVTPRTDAQPWLRIFWAAVTALLTIGILMVGGIPALQNATIIMGLPFAIVVLLVMVGLWKALADEGRRIESRHRVVEPSILGSSTMVRQRPSWRSRMSKAFNTVSRRRAEEYLNRVVIPALEDVATAFRDEGTTAEVISGEDEDMSLIDAGDEPTRYVALVAQCGEEETFRYRVSIRTVAAPSYGRALDVEDVTTRLEVNGISDEPYDVFGYSTDELRHDILDHYERYVDFRRIYEIESSIT
ncbi:BCCT family transporter [Dermatophilus congolensis]|nr:choline BCCT transporter BetT [Dermatophilus congolensis]MBO3142387.1 BCCT family transporter [Dermatophilus congolensis]MBO3151378.1 BCCT family transporter [Dermatophilus congolensis]MBO3161618.1 BCCT family transporter [Dermatophilus congolensis]MBO3162664.1 BCCT family transporter [Dermatophilus congolensis]MBO3176217.1 BCCT family transporter [Dermatophilus congolensis]